MKNDAIESAYDIDDFTLNISGGILEPKLNEPIAIPTQPDQQPVVDDNSDPVSLTLLVSDFIPLNTKQRLVVEKVLSEALG